MSNRIDAQSALNQLKEVILRELRENSSGGLTNANLVTRLGLESSFEGKNKNYLSWSLLGILISEGRVFYEGDQRERHYFAK